LPEPRKPVITVSGIGAGGNRQPDGVAPPARQNHLLHRAEQVVDLFVVVQHDVGVAGDAKGAGRRHVGAGKTGRQALGDHVFHGGPMRALGRRERNPSGQLTGDRHDRQPLDRRTVGAGHRQSRRDVQLQVGQ